MCVNIYGTECCSSCSIIAYIKLARQFQLCSSLASCHVYPRAKCEDSLNMLFVLYVFTMRNHVIGFGLRWAKQGNRIPFHLCYFARGHLAS